LSLELPGLPSSSPAPPKGKKRAAKKQPDVLATVDDVLSKPESLHTERLHMRDALTVSIKRKGGSQQAYIKVTASIYRLGFGYQSARLFYEAYNLPPNSRSRLPPGVLRVLIVYEFAIMRRLDSHTLEASAQTDVDNEIVEQSKLAIQATKRFLYWLDCGTTLPGS